MLDYFRPKRTTRSSSLSSSSSSSYPVIESNRKEFQFDTFHTSNLQSYPTALREIKEGENVEKSDEEWEDNEGKEKGREEVEVEEEEKEENLKGKKRFNFILLFKRNEKYKEKKLLKIKEKRKIAIFLTTKKREKKISKKLCLWNKRCVGRSF